LKKENKMPQLILKGSALYLDMERKIGESKLDYVMLNLPFQCNYQCGKCCNRNRAYKKGRLQLGQIQNFIWRCKNLGARVLVMVGEGEPTLDHNFRKIIAYTNKIGLTPYIFTNGSMLNRELAIFLTQNNASLIINIDFLDANKYDKAVNKKGAFKELMENIRITREIYRPKIFTLGRFQVTYLAVNLVLNNENFSQIKKIKEFCNDDILFVVNKPIKIGAAAQSWEKFDQAEDLLISPEVSYPLGTVVEGEPCAYLRHGISVGSDGSVLACAYALETSGLFGDIDDDIVSARAEILKAIDDFYKKHGWSRCIVRHPKYNLFKKEKR